MPSVASTEGGRSLKRVTMQGTQPDAATVTTAILAGGAASRLGGLDKGLYLLKDRPLVAWVIEAIRREQTGPIMIVANRNIPRYSQFAETVSDLGSGHAGPLAGVCAALAACRTPWLFTVPVDCVRPPPRILQNLLTAMRQQGGRAVVAWGRSRRQPLFALYSTDLLASCTQAIAQHQGVSRWQDSTGTREVGVANPEEDWINLNSAEEFLAFEEALDE